MLFSISVSVFRIQIQWVWFLCDIVCAYMQLQYCLSISNGMLLILQILAIIQHQIFAVVVVVVRLW